MPHYAAFVRTLALAIVSAETAQCWNTLGAIDLDSVSFLQQTSRELRGSESRAAEARDEWPQANMGISIPRETLWQWSSVACVPLLLWASSSSSLPVAVTIGCWMLSSLSMNVANKQASTLFTAPSLLVIAQMLLADLVILVMQCRELSYGNWRDLVRWSIIPFFFAGMLTTSVLAFKETTMSTVLILRNVLPLIAFAAEKMLMNVPRNITPSLVLSMLLTLAGTVLYGYTSASVTSRGAVIIGFNCVITVMDRLLQRYFLSSSDFSVSLPLCMVVNNSMGILPMLAFAFIKGEMSTWKGATQEATGHVWFWVVMSGLVGCCLGYQGLRCQKVVTATTFLMLQNFVKIAVISVDVTLMQSTVAGLSLLGCAVSMAGSFWYGAEQIRTRADDEAELIVNKAAKPT